LSNRVFVTGTGIISSIGLNAREVFESLVKQRTGIDILTGLPSVHRGEIPVAEVRITEKELINRAKPAVKSRYGRTGLLALAAARQAVEEARLGFLSDPRTGLISATTVGGMDRSEIFYRQFRTDHTKGKLADIAGHDCADSTEGLALALGIHGYVSTINTACSSSANSIMSAVRLIRHGVLDRAVAGGSDALTLFTLNGFNSLLILDKEPCKPFDENRNGLNLGEGAGFLVLESESEVIKRGKTILGEIRGFGNSCDAYHQTASSPDGNGAYLAMKQALDSAGLEPGEISYINAHGTGTRNNDLSEGIAIQRIFGEQIPPVSSTKAYTGHTVGAAGAIEAVLCILALQHDCVYPNLNFTQRMRELSFSPVTAWQTGTAIRHILSNSFGFGGNNSSLIISRP
jgi:3-oxoacyl-(acyl-carrier-protein) synthase